MANGENLAVYTTATAFLGVICAACIGAAIITWHLPDRPGYHGIAYCFMFAAFFNLLIIALVWTLR